MLCAAYLSLFERKVIARVQRRLGPSYTGPFGMMQPIADILKLFFKRGVLSVYSKRSIISIVALMLCSLMSITMIPISSDLYIFNPKFGLLYILVFHTIFTFTEIIIGTESGSKYGIIGGFRAYFQAISSYIPYVLSILCVALLTNSFNLIDIVELQKPVPFIISMFPVFFIFFIVSTITLNRTPFDFTEAESEIIAGNYVEYGGMLFGMLYLCEYINLVFSASIVSLLFLGGWHSIPGLSFLPPHISMFIKITTIIVIMILIRAILPRYKQEHVIRISWSIFCPALVIYFMIFQSIVP